MGKPKSDAHRARIADAMRGKNMGKPAWNKGLTAAVDERVARYAARLAGRQLSDVHKVRLAAARLKNVWYANCQACGRTKGFNNAPRCVWCAAAFRTLIYPNSMRGRRLSDAHRDALLAGQHRRPTRPECAMSEFLGAVFGGYSPWRYVGDGSFWIRLPSGKVKNPDFVDTRQQKIIEVFGRYWHRNDDPQALTATYRTAGWDCLVLWDDESSGLRDRIMLFTYPYEYDAELEEAARVLA